MRRSLCTDDAIAKTGDVVQLEFVIGDQSKDSLPAGGLTSDAAGDLYGTTQECTGDCGGTVFMLTKSSGKWIFGVLHAFEGAQDGGGPYAGVIFDASGNLYGTTTLGGKNGQGTVFRLSPLGRPMAGDGDSFL